MNIDKFFVNEYLTVGKTYDNFIFENCPENFLLLAKAHLSKSSDNVKSCCITLTKNIEDKVVATLNNCEQDFQQKILARDYITALIVKEVLKYDNSKAEELTQLSRHIQAFLDNDFEKAKEYHLDSYMPFDVRRLMKNIGKIELNFFLDKTTNIYLQQAINIFISSREPYSVKIFTSNKYLPSYYDLNGNRIECPHDFMRRNVNDFIECGIEIK